MIVEIFVTQREPEHPLSDQRFERVLRSGWIPVVIEASRHTRAQPHDLVRIPQKQRSAVRLHPPAVKSAYDLTPARNSKHHRIPYTLCHDGNRSTNQGKSLPIIHLTHVYVPSYTALVSDPG